MNRKRISVLVLSAAAAVALYASAGFLILPYAAKSWLVAHVEQDLGHRLGLGAVRFNPFTFRLELADVDLREADGRPLFAAARLATDLEAASLWRRAWTFAAMEAQAPHLTFELRPGGRHNFSALLDALRDPTPEPSGPLPALAIGRIAIGEGRIDLADAQAGATARLTLAPIAFELTELTTETDDTAPYKLTGRSADGERVEWRGEVSVNPAASSGHLTLQGWNVATLVRLLGNRLSLQRSAGTIDVALDYRASYAAGAGALALSNVTASIAGLALQNHGEAEPFAAVERVQLSAAAIDPVARTFAIERIELARPALALALHADGTPNWLRSVNAASGAAPRSLQTPVAATPAAATEPSSPATTEPATAAATEPSSPATTEPATAAATEPSTTAGTEPTKAAATASSTAAAVQAPAARPDEPAPAWRGRFGQLVVADGRIAFSDRRPDGPTLELAGLGIALGAELANAQAGASLSLASPRLTLAQLRASAGTQQLEVGELAVTAGALTLQLADSALEAASSTLAIDLAAIGVRQRDAEWQGRMLTLRADQLQASPAAGAQATAVAFDVGGIAAHLGKRAKPALEAGSAAVRAQAIAWDARAGSVRLDGATGSIDALHVRDPGSGDTLARLARAQIAGAGASSGERRIGIDAVTLTDAHATAIVATDGKSNWDGLLAAFGAGGEQPPAAKAGSAAAPWSIAAKRIEVKNLGGSFSDRRHDPPLAVELTQVNARAHNASTERKRPMRVEASGRIDGSGQFEAAGRIDVRAPAVDLNVKLAGISLLPLQPFLARHARVQLVSALASAEGRVRYNMAQAAGADLVFEGALGLDKVIVEETEPAQPFLSVQALRASQTKLTLGPDRLEIPDLRLNTLVTRLLIAEDQSVNIAQLLRRPKPEPTPAKAPVAQPAESGDTFPIVISRVRLDNSVLEFSDLSLRPQFNTRMHELQGVITGISTATDTRARMELEARVDEFGSARINGAMNLFKPRVFTDVTMVFRNLEMTDLTPYAAKFAGYRIASGKLSMDLHYRIRNSALVGDNKIMVDKLVLGERVESATALDLPLELAIAILQDENGRIDIGLPVTGSLEDPQFSIAGIVWKALGSLLGRVVTAPFRALARLFGGGSGGEDLDSIEFAPGAARLAAPERQKLETVAAALAKRPDLKVIVQPAYAPEGDREALQSAAVRREVLAQAGIKLEPGEAPGPLDYGNARIRQAIEELFTGAFGFPAGRDLRASVASSARKPPAETAAKPAPEARSAEDAKPQPAAPAASSGEGAKPQAPVAGNVRIARAMTRRLTEARTVGDAELTKLAQGRAETVAAALRDSAKVDPARIAIAAPRAVAGDSEQVVPTRLELGVAK